MIRKIKRETESEKYQKPEVKVQVMSMRALLGENGWFVDKKSNLLAFVPAC